MTKIQLNENELIQIVEAATKNALSKILNEGAGLNTMGQSFKAGLKGTQYMDADGGDVAANYIKNGDGTNYDEFKRNREQYNKARNLQRKRQNDLNNKMKEPDAWAVSDMEDAHNRVADAKANTEMAASDTIGSRPGIIGKGQRAANVGAYRAGKALKGVKDSATKFMHDKIGLEE